MGPVLSLALALALTAPQQTAPAGAESAASRPALPDAMHYRCIGPTRGGRVTTVAGVAQELGTFYMGSTGGGVWKTTDFGHNWRSVTDGSSLASPAIGAIRVAPSDPSVVWVGTGSDGLRSNIITGRGVWRSTDAAKTWTFVGLRETGHIGAIEVHPDDPNLAFVAAIGQAFGPSEERGLFRTRDGGKTWERVLFVSKDTGIVDVEFNPADPNELYATAWQARRHPWTILSGGEEGGVFRSRDGGDSWTRLGGGLPSGLIGKADLAVSRDDPRRVYVLIEAPGDAGGVYRSDDRGDTFEQVSDHSGVRKRPFYYTNLDADPSDADVLYAHATGEYKSSDGGKTWRRRSTPHGDNHDMWIHPDHPEVFVQANDGGANVTRDGGKTWSTQLNQPTAELYQVAVDDRFPAWAYAGQQDNSTIRVPLLPPHGSPAGPQGYWQSVGGCETGPVIPKPGDPDIVYANCKGRFGVFDFRTGQERHYYVGASNLYGHNPKDLAFRFQRVAPIHVSPHDPNVVYHGSQFVHRTVDDGVTWERISPDLTAFEADKQVVPGAPITRDITGEEYYSCVYAIRESPVTRGVIWVGANDGPVHVTRDDGVSWQNVTPPGLPPGGRVQSIEPSPHDAAKAYVTVYRFLLDDWQPYVYRTDDYGRTWTRLTDGTNGIPADTPTRVCREDPTREGLLYCGTEFGMFVSFDDGGAWQSLQFDLPLTPVTDLVISGSDLVLSTMGRSFWVLDDLTPLRQWRQDIAAETVELFEPRPAHRMRYRARRGVPEYPPAGATIDYWLAAAPTEPLELTIENADGRVIRRFTSAAQPKPRTDDEPTMRAEVTRVTASTQLPAKAGHNRFRWDLKHDGPWHENDRMRGRGGPLVAPGTYALRLRAGDVERTVLLAVMLDPRVTASGITFDDVRAQERLQLEIRDTTSEARRLVAELEAARETASDDAARSAIEAKLAELVDAKGIEYPQPMLLNQLRYLQSMLDRADQRPGRDAELRLAELESRLDALR